MCPIPRRKLHFLDHEEHQDVLVSSWRLMRLRRVESFGKRLGQWLFFNRRESFKIHFLLRHVFGCSAAQFYAPTWNFSGIYDTR